MSSCAQVEEMRSSIAINGREFSERLIIELAPRVASDRAAFIAELRVDREFTWSMVAEECGKAWQKDWGPCQRVGQALCRIAAAHLGCEDLDSL
jgi:hypothetical protein